MAARLRWRVRRYAARCRKWLAAPGVRPAGRGVGTPSILENHRRRPWTPLANERRHAHVVLRRAPFPPNDAAGLTPRAPSGALPSSVRLGGEDTATLKRPATRHQQQHACPHGEQDGCARLQIARRWRTFKCPGLVSAPSSLSTRAKRSLRPNDTTAEPHVRPPIASLWPGGEH